jgi:hypothetical protein
LVRHDIVVSHLEEKNKLNMLNQINEYFELKCLSAWTPGKHVSGFVSMMLSLSV